MPATRIANYCNNRESLTEGKFMYKKKNPVTRLCTSDVDNIWIRGRNLCDEIIGRMSFTDFIVFHFLGKDASPLQHAVVDAVLVCIMEHGMTPSAVASRVTYLGAPESLQGAVAAGLLGAGSRFVGTADEAAALLTRIVSKAKPDRANEALIIAQEFHSAKKFLPGYGHPIHTNGDPRVKRLDEVARAAKAKGEATICVTPPQKGLASLPCAQAGLATKRPKHANSV